MSTSAIVMLIVAVLIVWGGLAASIVQLRRHPEQPETGSPGEPTV